MERKERRRSGDIRKVTHQGKALPDAAAVHERLWKKLEDGVSVWIVNGRLVRSTFDIDFTAGGHDHVYEFVPEKEVGSMTPLRKKKGDLSCFTNYTSGTGWRAAGHTARRTTSRAGWSSGAGIIRMSCKMRLRMKAGLESEPSGTE